MADNPQDLSHTLLPLALACEVIFEKLHRAPPADVPREHLLNSIAATIAAVAPIYEYSAHAGVSRRLTTDDLVGGRFNRAGKELVFGDGRKARSSLAVSANDITAVVERLKELGRK